MKDEFLLVLNKMGYRTRGGGATGGRISYDKPGKDEVVTLRLHPMDGRVLDFEVSVGGNSIATGKDPKQLLRTLQDKSGSGTFRKSTYAPDRKASFIPDPSPFRKINSSMYEDLDQYGNNIERAILEIFQLDEQTVKDLVNRMKFEEYLNLAIALDNENMQLAEEILQSYGIKSMSRPKDISKGPTPESVTQHINYLTKNNEDNIVTPEFRQLNEFEQRGVLNSLFVSQIQKILANLRGYSEPGMYESSLFMPTMVEEIMLKLKSLRFDEAIPNAPNKPNTASSDTRLEKDAEVAVTNDSGETEDATVVNDTGNMVTVQTKTGRKTVKKDKIMQSIVDENAIDIKRFKELAGIKAQPIQKQVEEEEEITEDDNSLGSSYTLEVDGEEVKKNDDAEDLMSYAEKHAGTDWIVYDSETGDIAASSDQDGFLQDADRDAVNRRGKIPGWEKQEELLRNPEQSPEPFENDWWKEFLITDKQATTLASRIMNKIGESWPDGDPMDAVITIMKKNARLTVDSIGWDAALEKVKIAFERDHGVDFYGYFDELTQQMQADNPGKYGDVPNLREMKMIDILGGMRLAISEEEYLVVDRIKQKEKVYKRSLEERDQQLAHNMVNRGVLNRFKDDEGIYYIINELQDLRRD